MGGRLGMGSPWQQQLQECGLPCRLQLQGAAGGGAQTVPQDLGRDGGCGTPPPASQAGKGAESGPWLLPALVPGHQVQKAQASRRPAGEMWEPK